MTEPDYYELLGVSREASTEEIKRAYRRLALELHPDRNPDDPSAAERFKAVTEAYQVLCDPEKRRRYDAFGRAGLEGGFPPGGVEDVFRHVEDIFSDFFGGFGTRHAGPRPSRGADLEVEVTISLAEAARGVRREVTFQHAAPCDACGGTGAEGGRLQSCGTCGGRGQVARGGAMGGFFVVTSTCPHCRGAGRVPAAPCDRCEGRGRVRVERTVTVHVPAGIADGQTLRLAGQGAPGERGGPPGHLYVHVAVEPDERFERQGDDLVHALTLDITQATLGTRRQVPSLLEEAPLEVEVPAGTQPGEEIVVPGEGMPRLDGTGRGDLRVRVQVEIPRKLSRTARKLMEKLARELAR